MVLYVEGDMSRTDNTDPLWVRAEWWEPRHFLCPRTCVSRWYRDCDLPDEPVRQHPQLVTHRAGDPHCRWLPCWTESWSWAKRGAPFWSWQPIYTGPERRRVRDQCRKAMQEYRGSGEVDIIPSTTQHRHVAAWDYW